MLSKEDIVKTSELYHVEPIYVHMFYNVESSGEGFYIKEGSFKGKPKVRLEGHKFRFFTKGIYDKSHPRLSYVYTRPDPNVRIGQAEYGRYNEATKLDLEAAQLATSFGGFQVMGFNHQAAGYGTVGEMVKSYEESELNQLNSMFQFLKTKGILFHLRNKNLGEVFLRYNGRDYVAQGYMVKANKELARLKKIYQ